MTMSIPEPSPGQIADSLAAAKAFGETIAPFIEEAWPFAVDAVRAIPPNGAADPDAQLQALPTYLRLAVHQIVAGHNARVPDADRIRRRHKRNLALCFAMREGEMRVLKRSAKYPTRPSGHWQERLIRQDVWREFATGGQRRLIDDDEPLLNPIMYWMTRGFELVAVKVVLPYGFLEGGGVRVLASTDVELGAALESAAIFSHTTGGGLILSDTPLLVEDGQTVGVEEAPERSGGDVLDDGLEVGADWDETGEE